MFDNIPPEVRAAGAGVAGSLLAMIWLRRAPLVMLGTFVGGCILSFYGTPWLARTMDMSHADGLVGFLIGLFGMALMAKVYDTIDAIKPEELWIAVRDFIRKKLGV